MAKTRDQMIHRVLTKLGYNASGQSVAPEDFTRVDENLETILAELSARQIFYVGDYDFYDDEAFEALSDYVASGLCEDFGQDENKWAARRADAIDRLELIAAPAGTGEPLRTDPMLRYGARYGRRGPILG